MEGFISLCGISLLPEASCDQVIEANSLGVYLKAMISPKGGGFIITTNGVLAQIETIVSEFKFVLGQIQGDPNNLYPDAPFAVLVIAATSEGEKEFILWREDDKSETSLQIHRLIITSRLFHLFAPEALEHWYLVQFSRL